MELSQTISNLIFEIQKLTQAVEKISKTQEISVDVLDEAIAFRWERENNKGSLVAIRKPQLISFNHLCNIDSQLTKVKLNTEAFAKGLLANNVLMTGSRGTGKSSIVKACLNEYHHLGLRVIELEKKYLEDLPKIINLLQDRTERFIIFCDDLAFEAADSSYATLKTVLDGSLASSSDNTLIYATSNRKHMVAEYNKDNTELNVGENGELRPGDSIEQKISLADRFGLQINFYGFSQQEYLKTVQYWLNEYKWQQRETWETIQLKAIQYATQQGNRSGRIANQFAKMIVGQEMLSAAGLAV